MQRVQRDDQLQAIGMLQTGRNQHEMDNAFVSKSVNSRLWNRYQQTQNVDDRPRSGHPRSTTGVQDQFSHNQTVQNPSQMANQIVANLHPATGVRVTDLMIRNRLHAAHLHA